VCLRYVNPDIDGDGVLDAEEPNRDFMLDFHTHFAMQRAGASATVGDLIDAFLPLDTPPAYQGTGNLRFLRQRFLTPATSRPRLGDFPWDVALHDLRPRQRWRRRGRRRLAGERRGAPELGLGDTRSVGVYGAAGYDLPEGEYDFGLGPTTLSFTNVAHPAGRRARGGAGLPDAVHPYQPRRTRPASAPAPSPASTSSGASTPATVVFATLAELALVVATAAASSACASQTTMARKGSRLTIPPTSVSVRSPGPRRARGLTTRAPRATTDELCHLGLARRQAGLRLFAGIANAPDTCPLQ